MTSLKQKFEKPKITSDGSERAWVPFSGLETLWFNTGSLCNLTCENCFMESSPTNDALLYLSHQEVSSYVDEAIDLYPNMKQVGFTGGEPFLNKDIISMIEDSLKKRLEVLVLTNAMKPMRKNEEDLLRLRRQYSSQLIIRVSLDHYTAENHDQERGAGGFEKTLDGIKWLSDNDFVLHVAGRSLWSETVAQARAGYHKLFSENNIQLPSDDALIVFPEMNKEDIKPPEITTQCWDILKVKPESMMCSTSRMVVKKKGAELPSVVRCTLLPYDAYFDSGSNLKESFQKTYLKHVYCAQFCVLGGASCSA